MDAHLEVSELSFCLTLTETVEPDEVVNFFLSIFKRDIVRSIGPSVEWVNARRYTLKIKPEEKDKLIEAFKKLCQEKKLSFHEPKIKVKIVIEEE